MTYDWLDMALWFQDQVLAKKRRKKRKKTLKSNVTSVIKGLLK